MLTRTSILLFTVGTLATVVTLSAPASPGQFGFLPPTVAAAMPEPISGIRVIGTGTVEVAPAEVIVALRIRARDNSPLASHSAYRDRRILFDKAMSAFDDVALRVESRGVTIGISNPQNQFIVNGQWNQSSPFETKEIIDATIPLGEDDARNIELISELIQAAVDVECSIDVLEGNPWNSRLLSDQRPAIRYRLSREGFVAARDQAMAAAMEDARDQAIMLAALAGHALGPVASVSVVTPFPTDTEVSGKTERSVTLSVRFQFME